MVKKKVLLASAFAVLTLGAAGAAFGVATNPNRLVKFSATEASTRVTDTITIPEGAALAGNAFYVNLSDVAGWWHGSNAETWAYFFNALKENAWVQITQAVPNDANVYEVTVPGGYSSTHYWNKVVICRSSGGQGDSTWSNIWNQTGNMNVTTDGYNGVSVHDGEWTDSSDNNKVKKTADAFKYTAETRMLKWANGGGTGEWTNSGVCVDSTQTSGDTNTSDLSASWTRSATEYAKIVGADVRDYMKCTDGTLGTSTDVLLRYDTIYQRYHSSLGLTDFLGRFNND